MHFSVPRALSPISPSIKKKVSSDSKAAWKAYMAKLKLQEMYPNPGDILLRGEKILNRKQKWW